MKIERIQADTTPVVVDRPKRDRRGVLTEDAVRFKDNGKGGSGGKGNYRQPGTRPQGTGAEITDKKDGDSVTNDHLDIVA